MSIMSTWSSRLPFFWWSAAWKPFQMGSQWQKWHWHCEKTHLSKKVPHAFLKSIKLLAGHSDRPPHSCQHGCRMVGVVPERDFFHQMADNRSKVHYDIDLITCRNSLCLLARASQWATAAASRAESRLSRSLTIATWRCWGLWMGRWCGCVWKFWEGLDEVGVDVAKSHLNLWIEHR